MRYNIVSTQRNSSESGESTASKSQTFDHEGRLLSIASIIKDQVEQIRQYASLVEAAWKCAKQDLGDPCVLTSRTLGCLDSIERIINPDRLEINDARRGEHLREPRHFLFRPVMAVASIQLIDNFNCLLEKFGVADEISTGTVPASSVFGYSTFCWRNELPHPDPSLLEVLSQAADLVITELGSALNSKQEGLVPAPRWDCERRELRFGKRLCKQFRGPAKNQELILAAFEEEGWPARIDSPLPLPKAKDNKQRLGDAVRRLNNNNQVLLFQRDGKSEGILWSVKKRKKA